MPKKGIIRNQRVTSEKVERSRELRRDMTEAEKAFWEIVRGKKFHGLKFRRQQIIDGFIVDFYCDSLGLCVEIDGSIHDTEEQSEYDKNRDEVLALRGLKVLRFTNDELFNEPDVVVEKLKNELCSHG
jgi:very-short-patch-repair endonuclease